jgi:hypothetical protein
MYIPIKKPRKTDRKKSIRHRSKLKAKNKRRHKQLQS